MASYSRTPRIVLPGNLIKIYRTAFDCNSHSGLHGLRGGLANNGIDLIYWIQCLIDDGILQLPNTSGGLLPIISDPCDCANGADTTGDGINDLALETITVTSIGSGETWELVAFTDMYDVAGNPITLPQTMTDNGDGTYTYSFYVLADGSTRYTAKFEEANGVLEASIIGSPCRPCGVISATPTPMPTVTAIVPTGTPVIPTGTPVVPTSTPVPVPTNTPMPTSTVIVPTATTAAPTSTPAVPTSTPVPTSTSVAPTATPVPPTATIPSTPTSTPVVNPTATPLIPTPTPTSTLAPTATATPIPPTPTPQNVSVDLSNTLLSFDILCNNANVGNELSYDARFNGSWDTGGCSGVTLTTEFRVWNQSREARPVTFNGGSRLYNSSGSIFNNNFNIFGCSEVQLGDTIAYEWRYRIDNPNSCIVDNLGTAIADQLYSGTHIVQAGDIACCPVVVPDPTATPTPAAPTATPLPTATPIPPTPTATSLAPTPTCSEEVTFVTTTNVTEQLVCADPLFGGSFNTVSFTIQCDLICDTCCTDATLGVTSVIRLLESDGVTQITQAGVDRSRGCASPGTGILLSTTYPCTMQPGDIIRLEWQYDSATTSLGACQGTLPANLDLPQVYDYIITAADVACCP